ncbi:unnamed protein product [Rotaria socialis]|uniref:Uncharacterized protein n=1 Tax=Rotaria socialis TaxID=392032 RepID=A0A818HY66_9BILA|nr:unnamed protein product [Rotaria socialis]
MLKSEVVNVPSGSGVQATPASPSYTGVSIIHELFKVNIVCGRRLFARGVVQVQMVPPFYTSIYIALVSVINTKFSQIDFNFFSLPKQNIIIDQTKSSLVALRRTLYLTIQSSIDAEEYAHKLLKMNCCPGQEKEYVECFEKVFQDQYDIVYRLENVKFFAHLLVTDAISWDILCCLVLTNEDTTSSSRVYMKNLFLELAESIGITQLEYFDGLFPRNDPKKTRFSRNFFTSIGRGGLTDDLREFITTDSC